MVKKGYKKHLIEITDKQNKRLQKIKSYLRLNNVDQTFSYLIDNFNSKFTEYLKNDDKKSM